MNLPADMFLASVQHNLIYVVVPKAASTSIKTWMLAIEGHGTESVHDDCRTYLQLSKIISKDRLKKEAFVFTFVRNPYRRLASAFLSKFVYWSKPRLTRAVTIERNPPKGRRGLSFIGFLRYLQTKDLAKVDVHWRPQHFFLRDLPPRMIGRVETMKRDFQVVQKIAGRRRVHLPFQNRNPDCTTEGDFSDISADVIRAGAPIGWRNLLSHEAKTLIKELYRIDFETFGYEL